MAFAFFNPYQLIWIYLARKFCTTIVLLTAKSIYRSMNAIVHVQQQQFSWRRVYYMNITYSTCKTRTTSKRIKTKTTTSPNFHFIERKPKATAHSKLCECAFRSDFTNVIEVEFNLFTFRVFVVSSVFLFLSSIIYNSIQCRHLRAPLECLQSYIACEFLLCTKKTWSNILLTPYINCSTISRYYYLHCDYESLTRTLCINVG